MFLEEIKKVNEYVKCTGVKYTRKSIWFKLECDNCKSIFERPSNYLNHSRRNNDKSHYCGECGNSHSLAGSKGNVNKKEKFRNLIGKKKVDSMGYMTIYVADTHPYSDGYCGRMREHVMIMENHLQRPMKKGEVIHHIDGNKLNNDISNLDVCTVEEHNGCHAKAEQIVFELYKRGIVEYDKENKIYKLKNGNIKW